MSDLPLSSARLVIVDWHWLSSCCRLAYTSVLRQFGVIWSLWIVKGLKTNILLVNWREQKNIFKSFPDKYYTACSVHQHSRYIYNCFHFLLEYYSCVRSIEHWIHLTILYQSDWLACFLNFLGCIISRFWFDEESNSLKWDHFDILKSFIGCSTGSTVQSTLQSAQYNMKQSSV